MINLDDFIGSLDRSATGLDTGKHDDNVFELDLNLWALVHMLAQDHPKELKTSFNFSEKVVSIIRSAPRSSIGTLASSHLLSFVLVQSEREVTDAMNNLAIANHPYIYLQNSIKYDDFSFAYWQILNRLSLKDVDYAAVVFGVSTSITERIKQLTDLKLRLLAAQFPPAFRLRFSQDLISERLNSPDLAAVSYFKSVQLSLKK